MSEDADIRMNYKQIIEPSKPVTMDSVGIENGHEVERLWLSDIVDGKYVEDYMTVERTAYDTVTDADGALLAVIENGMMLVKAPNMKHYRIPESVYRIADYAFMGCTEMTDIDVPYSVDDYQIEKALEHSHKQMNIHAWNWAYDSTRSAELEQEITEGLTDEYGFVYSRDGKRLLRAARLLTERKNIGVYRIPEGVERIDRLAFVNCIFEELHVPYTCKLDELPLDEYPIFGSERVQGCVLLWDRPYDQEDEIDDSLYLTKNTQIIDEYGVAFSNNMKRLLWSNLDFDETEYQVPDGVETICSNAFAHCKRHLTLSVPTSIKVIGDRLFGEKGGKIIIRKE